MNIESAQYRNYGDIKKDSIIAIIDGVRWSIPTDPANRHYQEILAQVKEKKLTIKEAD